MKVVVLLLLMPVMTQSQTTENIMMLAEKVFFLKPSATAKFQSSAYNTDQVHFERGERFEKVGLSPKRDSISLKNKHNVIVFVSRRSFLTEASDLVKYFVSNYKVNSLKGAYGAGTWQELVDEKVKVGWSKELCLLSWGEPRLKLETPSNNNSHEEQWVYTKGTLKFKNEVVIGIDY